MANEYLSSLFSLDGKVAVVTGAAGYFGKAFSETLLDSGAKVILLARGDKVRALSDQLGEAFGSDRVAYYDVDFTDEEGYRKALQGALASHDSIDILVNNAFEFSPETGFNDPSGTIEGMSKAQWMRSLESGVYWHALATKILAPKMKQQGAGSIINVSSMYALVSPDPSLYEGTDILNPPSYGAAKSALIAFTRYTASFYGSFGVRCNALVPGAFPNVDPQAFNSPKDDGFMKKLSDRTVLKRVGRINELSGPVIFLASDSSAYMTGQVMVVDGGWTVR